MTRSFSRNDRTSIRRVTFDGGERKDGSFRFAGRKTNSRRPTLSPTPWRINGGGGKPPPRFLHPRSSRLLISLSSIELFSKGEGGRRVQRAKRKTCGGRMERLSNSRTAKGANTPFLLLRVGSRCVSFFFRENDSGREGENRVI